MMLYLHGFRSSPASMKSRTMVARMAELGLADQILSPQLPASPQQAMELCLALVDGIPAHELSVVGSSLGGFYATWLAERLGCRAVLVNPAVVPNLDLSPYVGVGTQFHSDQPFEFKEEYLDQLRALEVAHITRPERYFLIAATGDEVLDYRDMVAHYAGARQQVIQGSDHAVSEFAQYVDTVLAFCGIGIGIGTGR